MSTSSFELLDAFVCCRKSSCVFRISNSTDIGQIYRRIILGGVQHDGSVER